MNTRNRLNWRSKTAATLLIFTTAGSCAMLAGCDIYAKQEAEKTIRSQLKDPDSANFSQVVIEHQGLFACGHVNAKNSMGGYVGDRQFLIWGQTVVIASDDLESARLDDCCTVMAPAVRDRTDSSKVARFTELCGGFLSEGFRW